jgi:hypothetical protein
MVAEYLTCPTVENSLVHENESILVLSSEMRVEGDHDKVIT